MIRRMLVRSSLYASHRTLKKINAPTPTDGPYELVSMAEGLSLTHSHQPIETTPRSNTKQNLLHPNTHQPNRRPLRAGVCGGGAPRGRGLARALRVSLRGAAHPGAITNTLFFPWSIGWDGAWASYKSSISTQSRVSLLSSSSQHPPNQQPPHQTPKTQEISSLSTEIEKLKVRKMHRAEEAATAQAQVKAAEDQLR